MQGFPMDSHVTYVTDPDTGVMTPQFDRAVTSEPLREYIKGVITNGVLPNPSTCLQVSAGSNGMTVVVSAGLCVIEGGLAIEKTQRTLEVTSADATYDRIDTVVVRWDSNDAARTVDLHIKAGVPASTPVRPTLTREGSIYEIGLADVFVTRGVVTITNEKITDTRLESARCGIVSSIAEWDTTTIFNQIQSELANFKSNEEVEFEQWFDYMKDQLTEDAAGRLQTEVDDVRGQIHTNLLNPTLDTTSTSGLTVTNNGDGTYTINGTSTSQPELYLCSISGLSGKHRLVGCPSGGAQNTFNLSYRIDGVWASRYEIGNGLEIDCDPTKTYQIAIVIRANQTVTNLTFKPMLTTDLSATYDSFVRYAGDGELNENVAAIKEEVEEHETRLDSAETTIGNHTDEIAQINADLSDKSGFLRSNMTTTVISAYSETSGAFTHNYAIPRDGFVALTGKTLGVGYVSITIGTMTIFTIISDDVNNIAEETIIPIKGGTTLTVTLNNGGFSINLFE